METAIADILDNSITANASMIKINFSWNDSSPWLSIADNGHGMSSEELVEAMRLGSQNPSKDRSEKDLGRFGLGLKTASLSQCRQLTVITKKQGVFNAYEWDLDWIRDTPSAGWKIRKVQEKDFVKFTSLKNIFSEVITTSGTIVLWRKLDRHDQSEKKLNSMIQHTRKHLELVFHRYISPESGRKGIQISLNNDLLEGFNPFNSLHPATQELPEQKVILENINIKVQPYVLPHYNKSSRIEYEKYAGAEGYLQNQGFYVYRNKRLIIKGTWFRLIKKEELTKLIRVQVDIPNSLDHLWKIDVKKSNASPPESIKKELRSIIDRIATSGKRVYKRRGRKLKETIKEPAWNRIQKDGNVQYTVNRNHYLINDFSKQLTPEQQQEFEMLTSLIEGSFPAELFYSDVAKSPESLEKPKFPKETYIPLLNAMSKKMQKNAIPPDQILGRILSCDPFAKYPNETKKILIEQGIINE